MNKVFQSGRFVNDPDAKNNACRFSLAVQRSFANKETGEKETDFFNCVAFGHTATYINNYIKKGTKVIIFGSLQNRNYETQSGEKRIVSEIIVDAVEVVGDKKQPTLTEAIETKIAPATEELPEEFNPFADD